MYLFIYLFYSTSTHNLFHPDLFIVNKTHQQKKSPPPTSQHDLTDDSGVHGVPERNDERGVGAGGCEHRHRVLGGRQQTCTWCHKHPLAQLWWKTQVKVIGIHIETLVLANIILYIIIIYDNFIMYNVNDLVFVRLKHQHI